MIHYCKPAFVPFVVDKVTVRSVWSTPTAISAQTLTLPLSTSSFTETVADCILIITSVNYKNTRMPVHHLVTFL